MRSALKILLGLGGALGVWHLWALGLDAPLVLPFPSDVGARLGQMPLGPLLGDVLSSLGKVGAVLGLVVLGGVPAGIVLGLSPRLFSVLRPVLVALQAIPVVSWLALVVFSFGIGWRGPVLISVLAFLPSALFTTVQGVHTLDSQLLEMATLYDVPRLKIFRHIILGSLRPFVGAVVDATAGGAWKAVLVTEYLCGDRGLGVRMAWARQSVDVEGVYVFSVLAVVFGIVTERAVRRIMDRRWGSWRTW